MRLSRRPNVLGIAALLIKSLTLGSAAAQEADEPFPPALMQRMVEADSADAREVATRELFREARPEDVRGLVMHADDEIALAAAWEVIRQTLDGEPDVDRDGGSASQPLGTDRVERFLGVLEGRLRVQPPEWWEKRFLLVEALGKNTITYPQTFLVTPFEPAKGSHPDNPLLLLPKSDRIETDDEHVFFVSGLADVRLPEPVATRLKESPHRETVVTGTVEDGVLFFAAHGRIPDRYELYAVSTERGELHWTSTVWSGYMAVRGYSGAGHVHWTWIQVSNGVVYVFGDAGHWLYVEGFRASDGKPVLRWATSY